MTVTMDFHGAAGSVTGSCYRVVHPQGSFLVDCGMFQGSKTLNALNHRPLPFDPRELSFVLLTHAHIDHSGMLPRLTKAGFRGPIYTSPSTIDLLTFMLPDSGSIQESEVERLNRRNQQRGQEKLTPIYTLEDAKACLRMAVDMQRRLAGLNAKWRERGVEQPFRVRMGINTGYCNVGNFGSNDRMDYTIIGAEANLAARLQSIAQANGIVLSYETYALVRDLVRGPLGLQLPGVVGRVDGQRAELRLGPLLLDDVRELVGQESASRARPGRVPAVPERDVRPDRVCHRTDRSSRSDLGSRDARPGRRVAAQAAPTTRLLWSALRISSTAAEAQMSKKGEPCRATNSRPERSFVCASASPGRAV